ncbi:hypothetical protein QH639_18060 [Lysinibacillus sp. 1 U-2021]|uniref:hypothetical protein n=1 Tax=Lysinibacillus sp. 1 U-2021 TaxID=3039426 RepID=UPI00247FB997|nr:hypothetical protein [Lysinibacillus sp. 1 U-2021]WGT37724.1 hypothetical protein QH639_18060 [Lysinibacillus sp. 1 U-2021]
MNFNQFLLENETVIGKQIWITDYRRGKSGGYVRHVPPTLVEVTCNSELPKNKRVYYSNYHFRKVKNGKVMKEIHAPYDNTGYRSYTGVSVNIFYTYEEAVQKYNEQIEEIIYSYNNEIKKIRNEMEEVNNRKIKIT